MARSDRLLRLLHTMRTMNAPITAARLAEESGVSLRSLYRDIDALRAAGARIEGERGYGYRLVEDPGLPPQTLDQAEIEALALGLAEVRALGDPVLARAAESVLAKVAAILPDARERQLMHAIAHIFRPEPRYPTIIDLQPLRDACWREEAVRLRYADRDGRRSERVIWPLALVYNDSCVTVLAWCCLRQDYRMFRSDRILASAPEAVSFRPRRVTLLREYVERLRAEREDRLASGESARYAADPPWAALPQIQADPSRDPAGHLASRRTLTIFHLIFAAPCVYVLARTLLPMTLPLWIKAAVAVLLLVASQYHYWSRLSSGSVFAPEFPRAIVILFNWAFGSIVLLAALQILLDLGTLVAMLVQRRGVTLPDEMRYAAAGLAAILAAIGVANALRVPLIKDLEVRVRNLPAQFDGYRLLQLTDLHISRLFPERWVRAVVERANASGVDLIVVTGDFIDGSVAVRRNDVAPLRDLRAPDGVYAIPGNHEYFFDYGAWMRHLAGLGLTMLPNAHTILARGDARLVLAGVTDLSAPASGHPGPDLAAALAGAPRNVPVILLDHQPKDADRAAARSVALQLSGHTHGGMIVGLDRLVARGNNGFVSGRYDVGGMTLYVSNGTALWPGFALRLGRPSELTRITLRALR